MRIRLKIDPSISRESLLAKLPLIVQSAVEAALEKSHRTASHVESGMWKPHSVSAVAQGEDDLYSQGHDVLAGIHSWLARSLSVETDLRKSTLSKDEYRQQVLDAHGVSLGTAITFEQAVEIDDILDMLPKKFVEDKLKTITTDGRFGTAKTRYPNHGRYVEAECKIILNPAIFGTETSYQNSSGNISKLAQTLIHEIGHGIDDKFGLSDKREWREISGWQYIGLDSEPSEGYDRLWIKDEGRTILKGRWAYKKGTSFPRWYGARNPKEDFCEAFTFAFLGCDDLFVGETGKAKLAFIKGAISKLEKSDNPGLGLELAGDEDLLKSQEFSRYFETRQSSLLDRDEIEAAQIIKSEFASETCDDLHLEKAGVAKPGVPGANVQVQGGGKATAKGMQKPGHKYLYRKELPGGGYRYFYQLPSGEHYHAEEPMHDEGRHLPQFKNDQEWDAHNAVHGVEQAANAEAIPQARPGEVDHAQFDPVAIPDLIPGMVTPDAEMFDPTAPKDDDKEEKKAQPEWRRNKPEREEKHFMLIPSDEKEIAEALKTWEIEDIDSDFTKHGVNLSFKVKLKNDGWSIMKPKAGSHVTVAKYGNLRYGINEMSTVHREALAYNIDKTLKWNLVPPTVLRAVKGMGQRRLVARMKEIFGTEPSNSQKKALEQLTSDKEREASMQFFCTGAKTFNEMYQDAKFINKVSTKELVRATLFDMVINHQDRHGGNLMMMEDQSADSRYGGEYRMVLIDNGYSMGNGNMQNANVYRSAIKFRISGEYLDKETIRDLRELRDDIRDKRRRRKIVDGEIRKNVPNDQIKRVADRIDFILSNRDAKKRVKMPDWSELSTWEDKHFPAKHGNEYDPRKNPFDITGRTAVLDKRDGAPEAFKGAGAMQDFLHPMLDYLNKSQMKQANDLVTAFGHFKQGNLNHNGFREKIVDFAHRLPKKLANQLFKKQKFHERFGLPERVHDHIKDDVDHYLNRDLAKEYEGHIKVRDIEVYNKMKRGELDRNGLKKAIGEKLFDKMEDRWLLPKAMREVEMQDKTDAIFDNPGHFGWDASKKAAPKEKPAVDEDAARKTDALSSGPERDARLKAKKGAKFEKSDGETLLIVLE